jgi:hypothetical protein
MNHGRSAGLAVLVVAAGIGLAACTSGPSSPPVASLGSGGGSGSGPSSGSSAATGGSTAASPAGNPTQLLDEWAACMRSHGDPNQTDPTIDADKEIHIFMRNVSAAMSAQAHGSTGPCSRYELAAEAALRGGQSAPKPPDMATEVKYAECMRAHGVPKYPDPNSADPAETKFNGTGIDPTSPFFQNADKLCEKQVGIPYVDPNAPDPGNVMVQSINAPSGQVPSGPPPSGAVLVPAGGSGGSG